MLEAAALEEEPQPLEEFVEDVEQYVCGSDERVRELLQAFKDKAGLDGGPPLLLAPAAGPCCWPLLLAPRAAGAVRLGLRLRPPCCVAARLLPVRGGDGVLCPPMLLWPLPLLLPHKASQHVRLPALVAGAGHRPTSCPAAPLPPAAEPQGKVGAKRKAQDPEKAANIAEAVAAHDWRKLAASGGLDKLTNVELQQYLEYHGLKKSGKKAELLQRIREHLEFTQAK